MTSPEYISKEELIDAVGLCLENAEQFIKDAELLIESSSFGHASAFGVLAYEELGKAFLSTVTVFLYYVENKDLIKKKMWRNRGRNPFMNHKIKQKFVKIIDELYEAIYQLFGAKELEMERLSEEDVKNIAKYFIRSPDKAINFVKSVFYCINEFKKDLEDVLEERGVDRIMEEFTLEEEKWCGLYVDYKEEKFISPKMVRRDEATWSLADVKRSFERVKEISIMLLELRHLDAIIKQFAELIARDMQ